MKCRAMLVLILPLGLAAGAPLASKAAARCMWTVWWPGAIGHKTFLLARATPDSARATVHPPFVLFRSRDVRAQVMEVEGVGGAEAAAVTDGLRTSRNRVVFVRHNRGIGCNQQADANGAFDVPGTSGLYIGEPRARSEWIDGQPTFDVFSAREQPLPDRLIGRNAIRSDGTVPTREMTMTAAELHDLYSTVWAESAAVGDTSITGRASTWIARNPATAAKLPARDIIEGAVGALAAASAEQRARPFGGTFTMRLSIDGGEPVRLYGRTTMEPQMAQVDEGRDSASGIMTYAVVRAFVVEMLVAQSLTAFPNMYTAGPCGRMPILVSGRDAELRADSTLRGTADLAWIRACAFEGTPLGVLLPPDSVLAGGRKPLAVTLRRTSSGAVLIDGVTSGDFPVKATLQGQRLSDTTYGPAFRR